jgi:hypothetical protein
MSARDLDALDGVDEQLVELVARLPLAPVSIVASLVGEGTSTAHRRVRNLLDRGLLTALAAPVRGTGRPARLLSPTQFGLDSLARCRGMEPWALLERLNPGNARAARLMAELPGLLAAYELLALLASSGPGVATLLAWERPWRRVFRPRAGRADHALPVVRLPAAATLTWTSHEETVGGGFALVPDTGGLALPAMRPVLSRLADHQATSLEPLDMIVIATTSSRRATAWLKLLETVSQARNTPALGARVVLWDELRAAVQGRSSATALPITRAGHSHARWEQMLDRPDRTVPDANRGPGSDRVFRVPPVRCTVPVTTPLDRVVLDLVGRHPFMARNTLAALVGRDSSWVRARETTLVDRGLLRVVHADEVTTPELRRQHLVELTRRGLEILAAHLGLPLGTAVRHHGLAGGGPVRPVGPRAALLAHLAHTVEADAVFAHFARALAVHPAGGALMEWRGAAACAHRAFRPDGYGLVRVGQHQHGFFLEFDRGTMRPDRLRAKFAAYHRFRAGHRAPRSYAGFPTLLVVTTGPGAEQRLARALQAAEAGQGSSLSALLTTTGMLETAHHGPLDQVWRTPADPRRRRAWT